MTQMLLIGLSKPHGLRAFNYVKCNSGTFSSVRYWNKLLSKMYFDFFCRFYPTHIQH